MRIPKKLTIRKSKWEVTLTRGHKKLDTRRYRGMCYLNTRQIFIDSGLTRNEREETFVHELLHACWPEGVCGNRLEEAIIESLSRTLYDVLKKNRLTKRRRKKKTTAT